MQLKKILTATAILGVVGTATYYVAKDNDQEIIYQRPLVIKKGGHYTGNYKGTADSAAVWIQTNDSVWLDDMNIVADAGGGLRMSGGTIVIANNILCNGLPATGKNQPGRAVDNYQPNYFKLSHFEFANTGGILFDHNKTGVSPLIQLYYGKIINTTRLKVDGSGGGLRAGMQFNTVRNMRQGSEAAWIEWNNEAGKSWIEDNFNFYNSSNFKLHDFCIKGAYPYLYKTSTGYSGSGVTADGSMAEGNNKANSTHDLEVWNGTILSTMNAAMNIAAGYNVYYHDNIAVSAGLTPDGFKSNRYWSGTCIFDGNGYPDSIFYNNRIINNTLGFVNNGNENYPTKGRQDENKDRKVNKMPEGLNKFLPDPITLTTEDSFYNIWKERSKSYKIGLLSAGEVIVPQPPPPPSVDTVSIPAPLPKRDTVYIRDTIKVAYPIYITTHDTLYAVPMFQYKFQKEKP